MAGAAAVDRRPLVAGLRGEERLRQDRRAVQADGEEPAGVRPGRGPRSSDHSGQQVGGDDEGSPAAEDKDRGTQVHGASRSRARRISWLSYRRTAKRMVMVTTAHPMQ